MDLSGPGIDVKLKERKKDSEIIWLFINSLTENTGISLGYELHCLT